jgi:hypothetical protein
MKQTKKVSNQPTMSYSKTFRASEECELLKIKAIKNFDTNYDLLKDIMLFQSPTYDTARNKAKADYLLRMIHEYTGIEGNNVKGNLYFTKGQAEFYPTVVAHYDTAQDYHEDLQIIQTKDWIYGFNNYTAKQCGIGADDSVGLYFAVEMLKRLDHCKVVLFYGEERGCIGSNECDMSFFDNSLIVTQLDRRSYSTDFIKYTNGYEVFPAEHYHLINQLMETYGYSFNDGSCTDVGALRRRGLKVASHNLSCGYLNEHMNDEVIHINSMENAFCFAQEMLEMISERNIPLSFPFVESKIAYDSYPTSRSAYSYFDDLKAAGIEPFKLETLSESAKHSILENMYGDYSAFDVDVDQISYYEGYYGDVEDWEKDVKSGELSCELFVALSGKCYNDLTKEVFELSNLDFKEKLIAGICPVTDTPIKRLPEYFIEYQVIYLRDCDAYIPYQFSPEDCFELPDDSKGSLRELCENYYF